jgi:hypothetical protein
MTHIITQVMLQPIDGPFAKSLEAAGCDRIQDILGMQSIDIDSLTVDSLSDDGKTITQIPMPLGRKGLLRAFISYIKYTQYQQTFTSYLVLTSDDFDDYRTTVYNPNQPFEAPPAVQSSKPLVGAHSSPVDDFRRGIKRDKSHYVVLKEDKQWDNWKRSTLATAHSHGCEEVFNPSYKPSTADDIAIFDEKQKFIYSVFEEKLCTDMGKFFV